MILHERLPDALLKARPLPGVAPVEGDWLWMDEAYAGQVALRRSLLDEKREAVLAMLPEAGPAAEELRELVGGLLPDMGFVRQDAAWLCPDGVLVQDVPGDPLETLGRVCQTDFCVMQKSEGEEEHRLTAAVLCFPASWRLAEKIGRPLVQIHARIEPYDAALGKRVQRLFDGVKVGRPLWRFNRLWYDDPALFQPRSVVAPRELPDQSAPFLRCERQVILRLPKTRAVVFAIHTYVLPRDVLPELS